MANLLPTFVDHVLRPTRTADEAAFASEVYHVRADGKEAGVVFSEMKARENTEGDKLDRELRTALLEGSPLAYEAGGLCDSIRKLTTNDVHAFHQRFYCGQNVTVIVGGSAKIPDKVLLDSLSPVLDSYSSHPDFDPGQPSWQEPISLEPLRENSKKFVHFPCMDPSVGSVAIGWRAPPAREAYFLAAIELLLEYLCGFDSSPLVEKFVMAESPIASDVSYEIETYLDVSTISLHFNGVEHLEDEDGEESQGEVEISNGIAPNGPNRVQPEEGVEEFGEGDEENDLVEDEVEDSFLASGKLGEIAIDFLASIVREGKLPGGLHAIRATAERHIEEFFSDLENDAHDVVPNSCVDEVIYGQRMGVPIGKECRGYLAILTRLAQESESFWVDLIDTAFVRCRRVEVYMIPDPDEAEALDSAEEAQIASRRESATPESRLEIQKRIDTFMDALKPEYFEEAALPTLPSTERVPRLPYSVAHSPPGPFHEQLVSVDSGLISATLLFSTRNMSFEQRLSLPILQDMLLSMDVVLDNGTRIPYGESSQAITEATVGTSQSGVWLEKLVGMGSECMGVSYSATVEKFDAATSLILRSIFHGQPSGARIASAIRNMDSDVVEAMRDAHTVQANAAAVLPKLLTGKCDRKIGDLELGSAFGRGPLLSFLANEYARPNPRGRIQRKVAGLLTSTLVALREQPASKVFLQIGARNPRKARDIFESRWSDCWRPETIDDVASTSAPPILHRRSETISDIIGSKGEIACCVGVAGSETVYFEVSSECRVDHGHADWASLKVLTEMLSRTEGPLYNAVRGAGLAYGVGMSFNIWQASISVSVHEASLPAAAWMAVCETLDSFRTSLRTADGSVGVMQSEMNTAKSSILYYQVSGKSTPSSILSSSFRSGVLDLPSGELADRILEERIEQVDLRSISAVYDKYVATLLNPEGRLATIACSPRRTEEVVDLFRICSAPILFRVVEMKDCELPPVKEFVASLNATK